MEQLKIGMFAMTTLVQKESSHDKLSELNARLTLWASSVSRRLEGVINYRTQSGRTVDTADEKKLEQLEEALKRLREFESDLNTCIYGTPSRHTDTQTKEQEEVGGSQDHLRGYTAP